MCRIAGPDPAPRRERRLVQRARSEAAAGDEHDGAVHRKLEPPARLVARSRPRRRAGSAARRRGTSRRRGPAPGTPAARGARTAPPAGWRARDARPPRSPPPESVAATRRAPSARRRSRRAPSTTSGRRRARILPHATGAAAASASALSSAIPGRRGNPATREGVERVAALRNEPRLDAIRRPGERHRHAAVAQRLRHRERRGDVPHRPAGRDQAPQLSVLFHDHGRC